MGEQEYIDAIIGCDDELRQVKKKKADLIRSFRRDFGFVEGDRVILSRKTFNVQTGEYDDEEYHLFIKTSEYHEGLRKFIYKFQHVTPNGRPSHSKCNLYHQPSTDKIIKFECS